MTYPFLKVSCTRVLWLKYDQSSKTMLLDVTLLRLGFVELCAKILQIMCNDFKDYAHTFANYAHIIRTFIGFVLHTFGVQHRRCNVISCISQTCYFHLCRLSSTRTWCHCQTVYCFRTCPSWLLQRHPCGSPDVQSTLAPLQWVLHVATHTVTPNLKLCDHVSTLGLRELHWLPVTARIQWLRFLNLSGKVLWFVAV